MAAELSVRRQAGQTQRAQTLFYCPSGGGLKLYSLELLLSFPADSSLLFVSSGHNPLPGIAWPTGVFVDWCSVGTEIRRKDSYPSRLLWALSRLCYYGRRELGLIRLLLEARGKFTTLHLQEGSLLLFVFLALLRPALGVRQIMTVHNVRQHDSKHRWVNELLDGIYPLIWRQFDALIVHGQRSKSRLLARSGITSSLVAVIPHPIPRKAPATRVLSDPAKRDLRTVLFFGSLRRNKGIDLLIPAIAQLDGFKLLIAGKADDQQLADEVTCMLRMLPRDRWQWVNEFIPEEAVAGFFHQSSLVALPYRNFEAQSGVLNYAFATATPCLVSDEGDMAEAVRTIGGGLVLSALSVGTLIEGIVEAHLPVTYSRLAEASAGFDFQSFNQLAGEKTARLYTDPAPGEKIL